eukprot:768603-Hanusia_phi.AAC.8
MEILAAAAEEEERRRSESRQNDFLENCKRFTVDSQYVEVGPGRSARPPSMRSEEEQSDLNGSRGHRFEAGGGGSAEEIGNFLSRFRIHRFGVVPKEDKTSTVEGVQAKVRGRKSAVKLDLEVLSVFRKICLKDYAWLTKLEDPSFDVNDQVKSSFAP